MRKMGIGLGVGINRSNYAQGIFDAYSARVVADGGVVESGTCVDAVSSLLQSASLLLIPSGYKGGKLYAEIPTNGNGDLTWTRGGDAFRTNASGLIQRVPWNLLQQSQNFADTSWVTLNSTRVSTTQTDPNGFSTALNLTWASGGSKYFYRTQSGLTLGTTYTLSFYVKSSNSSKFRIYSESLGTTTSNLTSTSDFARYTLTFTATVTSGTIGLQAASDNTAADLIVAFAQLVEGTTAQTYLPTTDRLNFPRLSYMYGSCPALLLEPQRTNLLPNQLSYNTATGVAYSTSVTDSPVIGLNSTRITKNEASGTLRYGNQICSSSALAGSTTYTISAYFKYDGYAVTTTMEYNNSLQWGGTSWNQIINIASTGVTLGSSSSCTGSVQNVGNGWYRVSVTITTGASISGGTPVSYLMQVASTLSTGQGFLQAAPQFEVGAYSTTPILTSGASATRVADSFSRNNIYTNGLISASGGTWFVELRGNETRTSTTEVVSAGLELGNSAGNATEALKFRRGGGSSRVNIWKIVGGTQSQIYELITDTSKIAIKWNGTSADVFVNGTKVVSATSFTATTSLEFLRYIADQVPTFIQQIALFPTALTDAQCQTLTT